MFSANYATTQAIFFFSFRVAMTMYNRVSSFLFLSLLATTIADHKWMTSALQLTPHKNNASHLPTKRSRRRMPFVSRRYRKLDEEDDVVATQGLFRNRGSILPTSTTTTIRPNANKQKRSVRNIHDLRRSILQDGLELRQLENDGVHDANDIVQSSLNHSVVALIAKRYKERSKPGNRTDPHKLALAIEGGGMRGAVSAGMAAALACLGLVDSFDAVYGSSAGSVVGAYMVSRQMCLDVYYDILPNAKKQFVSKKRMMASLFLNAIQHSISSILGNPTRPKAPPGMNISFVLDSVLDPESDGLRALDLQSFYTHNEFQPLRVVSSCVWSNGTLDTKYFGTEEFESVVSDTGRRGLFAALEASMSVPGATGPPVYIRNFTDPSADGCFFDAFCFEPLPYRSAVEEGATHVVVFQSRPADFKAKTQPGVYEKGVAPLYFNSHQQPSVAKFFRQGGQQYRYLEDYMTCEQGRSMKEQPIPIPPTHLQYGVPGKPLSHTDVSKWPKAHFLPIAVPSGTPELATLEKDPEKVLEAVRQGFAAAFDTLAPALGLELDVLTGTRAAELVFPSIHHHPTISCTDVRETSAHALLQRIGTPLQFATSSMKREPVF